jgi:hypothetical protein
MTKGYYEIELGDLIHKAGGREALKSMKANGKDPYTVLLRIQDEMIIDLLDDYKEVGEVFASWIGDYCDSL